MYEIARMKIKQSKELFDSIGKIGIEVHPSHSFVF